MRIFALLNMKGGVGKTTTAVNPVYLLALFADGLMDKLGPLGFLAAGAGALAVAWGLVRTGERSRQ